MNQTREYIAYCQTERRSVPATFLMSRSELKVQSPEGGLHVATGSALVQEGVTK